MKKKFNIILIIIIILFGLTLMLSNVSTQNMKALRIDSGFDSDWDFGGSDWGGSDWGDSDWSSSSWDYDYSSHNYSSSSGNRGTSDGKYFLILLIIIILVYAPNIASLFRRRKVVDTPLVENEYAVNNIMKELPDFNKDEFYYMVYHHFVDVQEAWMNFDYDKLRSLLTDELFNTYKSQLKTLSIKKQKNIMTDFEKVDIVINRFQVSEKEYAFTTTLRVKFYDYLVDQNNKVLRGKKNERMVMTYNLTFVKSKSDKQNNCPNCGASLDNVASNVCPYCNSVIVSNTHGYVLSKKEAISQRVE